jgi:hypothetical protein
MHEPKTGKLHQSQQPSQYLLKFSWHKIKRHTMVKNDASPDDPSLKEYWESRNKKKSETFVGGKGIEISPTHPLNNVSGNSAGSVITIESRVATTKKKKYASSLGAKSCSQIDYLPKLLDRKTLVHII